MNGYIELSNGERIPSIGFGTWQTPDGKTAERAVSFALRNGYSHIDAAAIYGNEKESEPASGHRECREKGFCHKQGLEY